MPIVGGCGKGTERSDCRLHLMIKLLAMFHTGWPSK